MTRRCSHCSTNGHNSRTCPARSGSSGTGGLKLFGVRLTDGSIIKKSASMGNLSAAATAASASPSSPLTEPSHFPDGYLSDDPAHGSGSVGRRGERKKGVPWTEDEHRLFLIGLQKLGKGDWRGIARSFVVTRTPTQVASHAQKYFIRQTNATRRKRRSSLFDMVPQTATDTPPLPEEHFFLPQAREAETANSQPPLFLSLSSEAEPMDTASIETPKEVEETATPSSDLPPMVPTFYPAYLPVPYPFWPPNITANEEGREPETSSHQVLRPTPVLAREPVNVDELVGLSQLSLREVEIGHAEPSPLSLKLLGSPSRQSAFHPNAPVGGSDLNDGKNSAIQAV